MAKLIAFRLSARIRLVKPVRSPGESLSRRYILDKALFAQRLSEVGGRVLPGQAAAHDWRQMAAAMRIWNRRAAAAAVLLCMAAAAHAQGRVGPPPPVSYDNKYEIYGGLQYMNFKAGENLPKRMNLGGVEIMATRWLTPK